MGKITGRILANANARIALIARLRNQSPYYPDYRFKKVRDTDPKEYIMYISTLLRIEKEGTWYINHHVEQQRVNLKIHDVTEKEVKLKLTKRLSKSVYLWMEFGEVSDLTDGEGKRIHPVDELQKSEKERLDL